MAKLYRLRPVSTGTSTPDAGPSDGQKIPLTVTNLGVGAGVAVARDEVVYFTDSTNHVIFKWRRGQQGQPTIFAGGYGLTGTTDGQAGTARFNGPTAIVADRRGFLWVVDKGNGRIRRVDENGNVKTVATIPTELNLSSPVSIAIDDFENVFVVGNG
jgi:sugar lactone lactonase YvrE